MNVNTRYKRNQTTGNLDILFVLTFQSANEYDEMVQVLNKYHGEEITRRMNQTVRISADYSVSCVIYEKQMCDLCNILSRKTIMVEADIE